MKIDQIRDMDTAALQEELKSAEREMMDLRMGNAIGTLDNPLEIRFKRRDIARMKTVLQQRQKAKV